MKVWILNPYGNLPNENWRPHRSFMASEAFTNAGHEVTYWISNIDHRSKQVRTVSSDLLSINGIKLRVVESTSYNEHISVDRIKFETNFIKEFAKKAVYEGELPDLIIIGEPSLFVSFTFVRFVEKHNIPFIIDMVDLWPELFRIILPKPLRFLDKILFAPLYWKRSWFIKKAAGILSVSEAYLEIAKKDNKSEKFKVVYLGVDLSNFDNIDVSDFTVPQKGNGEFWVIYAGTLGNNYDTKGLIDLAKSIENSKLDLKLFIAGDGNLKNFVLNSIKEFRLQKTQFLGRLTPNYLVNLYQQCDIALSMYSKDSTVSMPVKAFDYFAAGLPIINSLGMDLKRFIEIYNVGLNYTPENHEELFGKILTLVQNPDVLLEMKNNSIQLAKRFDKKNIYKHYVEFAEEVYSKLYC